MKTVDARIQNLADRLLRQQAALRKGLEELHDILNDVERLMLRQMDPIIESLDQVSLAPPVPMYTVDLGDTWVRSESFVRKYYPGLANLSPSERRFAREREADRAKVEGWYHSSRSNVNGFED